MSLLLYYMVTFYVLLFNNDSYSYAYVMFIGKFLILRVQIISIFHFLLDQGNTFLELLALQKFGLANLDDIASFIPALSFHLLDLYHFLERVCHPLSVTL